MVAKNKHHGSYIWGPQVKRLIEKIQTVTAVKSLASSSSLASVANWSSRELQQSLICNARSRPLGNYFHSLSLSLPLSLPLSIHIYMHICIYIHIFLLCIYIHIFFLFIYIHIYIYIHLYLDIHMPRFLHTHIHTLIKKAQVHPNPSRIVAESHREREPT